MSKKQVVKTIIFIFLGFFVLFLLLKPYNELCRVANWCQPLSFSYLMPSFKGEKSINFTFKAESELEDVVFKVLGVDEVSLLSGSKFSVKYRIVNNSKGDIEIRPMRFFENARAAKYLKFYECLCFQSYQVRAGEEIDLVMRFKVKLGLDDDEDFQSGEEVVIGYELMEE